MSRSFIATLAVALSSVAASAALPQSTVKPAEILKEVNSDMGGRIAMYSVAATAFREKASDKPQDAVDYVFDSEAKEAWEADVVQGLSLHDVTLADFFTCAIPLMGPQNESSGIVGLYNPWWDAILLLEMYPVAGHPVARDGEPAVLVKNFHFLSGETFRGEEPEARDEDVRRLTVVPEKDPISVEVWRVTSATVRRFKELLPIDGEDMFGGCGEMFITLDNALEARRLSVRAGLRLIFARTLLKDSKRLARGVHVLKMAKEGNLVQLYNTFRAPETRSMLGTFAELPQEFRRDFVLSSAVETPQATLYILVNRKYSRLYATATVPKDVPATPASFEWYDLDRAEELLALWNDRAEGKEVAK